MTTSDPLRYGIVGVAGVGRIHADIIERTSAVDLVACTDLDEASAVEFADERNCRWFTDPVEMVGDADVDAVSVCTPSGTHADIAIGCLESGVHVLCEKPLEVYRDRLDAMMEADARSEAMLAGVFQKRAYPEHRRAKQAVENDELGRIVLGTAMVKWYRSQEYYDSAAWRGTRAMDGGCLLNQAIHHIDVLQWIMGGVTGVYARHQTVERVMEMENVATMLLEFDNGALGTVEATMATRGGRSRVEVNGTHGSYNDGTFVTADAKPDIEYDPDQDRQFGDAHGAVIEDFVTAIRDERDPMVPAEAARAAVDVVLACYESAKRNEWIDVGEFRNGS